MPIVTITRREAHKGLLPEVCALTGEPTDGVKPRTFYWQPAWVFALLPVGLLPCLIVVYVLRKSMHVHLPLAHHKHFHWGWRMLVGFVPVVVSALAFIFGGATVSSFNPTSAEVGKWCMIGGGVGFAAALALNIVLTVTGIHPTKITPKEITLAGVHQNFVDALEREREQDEEEEARERERERDARDRRRERDRVLDDDRPPRQVPRAKRVDAETPNDWRE